MSYFNAEQQDYMRSLDAIPVEKLCWCGWYRLGEDRGHGRCNETHPGQSRADFLAAACKVCFTLPPHHVIGCKERKEDEPCR